MALLVRDLQRVEPFVGVKSVSDQVDRTASADIADGQHFFSRNNGEQDQRR